MANIQRKLEILENGGLIPRGLNIPFDYKIIDVKAVEFDFHDYKYSVSDESFRNTIVSIKIQHKDSESFFVNIFEGATYDETDVQIVTISLSSIVNEDGSCNYDYIDECDCVTNADEHFEGMEAFEEALKAFNCRLFDGDETGLYTDEEPTLSGKYGILSDIARKIINVNFLVINEIINKENPEVEKVKDTFEKLLTTSSGKLYSVTVIVENELKAFTPFLEKERAEQIYLCNCKEWYNDLGYEAFAENNGLDVETMTIQEWESYFRSQEYYDNNDISGVCINVM